MTRPAAQSGFTLVETLVALAIVGLSMAVMFKIVSDNLDRSRRAQDEVLAAAHIQSLLAQSQSGDPQIGASAGRFADGYAWQVDVAPYPGADVRATWPVDAVTVTAAVSWRDGGTSHVRRLSTLRVIPRETRQ